MQKRNLDIQYCNTNEEELSDGYTFILPGDKYKNININLKKDDKEEKKNEDNKKNKRNGKN